MNKRNSTKNDAKRKIRDRLLAQAETIEIELGGETFHFLLGVRGSKLAKERGHDPVPVLFEALKRIAPIWFSVAADAGERPSVEQMLTFAAQAVTTDLLEDLAVIVWSGLLPFEEDLLLEEVEIMLTAKSLWGVIEQVYPKMLAFADDMQEEKEDAAEAAEESPESEEEGQGN